MPGRGTTVVLDDQVGRFSEDPVVQGRVYGGFGEPSVPGATAVFPKLRRPGLSFTGHKDMTVEEEAVFAYRSCRVYIKHQMLSFVQGPDTSYNIR